MHERKTYFILSSSDYAPDELIQLGQVISELNLPHRRLSPPLQPPPKVYSAGLVDYAKEKTKTLSGSAGVFAKFLALLGGPGGDLSGHFSKENIDKWKFQKLETKFIEPDDAYVKSSVQVQAVKDFLDKNKLLGKSVYMVTGVKIARGPSANRKVSQGIGGDADLALDITALTGAPIQAGPKLSLDKKHEDSEVYGSGTDFIFAYRLQKIFVHRSGRVDSKELTGGDLLGYEEGESSDESDESEEEPGEIEIDSVKLEARDLGSDYVPVGFEAITVPDDADEKDCQVLWLKDR